MLVLAGLGLLASMRPLSAQAQTAGTVLPAGTVPVLRGLVGGQVVVNPSVATSTGRLLTIDQSSSQAIIDWKAFNIAGGSEVKFNQPAVTASVLNRIYSADPSLIQGRLTANGQVLLINQNGILFDRGAQINVQSLVASTLNVSNSLFNSGALTTGGLTLPAFAGGYDDAGNTLPARPDGTPPGAVIIGGFGAAAAAAPALTANSGGSIIIVAPRIDNTSGIISAPDGQVILAAGGKAYLALADAQDTTLRGFQVEIEAAPDSPLNITNLIRNAGSISADRGNVTLAALTVNQDGRVSADTAIQANGSIFLQARTLGNAQAGTVSLGAGSVTQVQPDPLDTATLPQSQSYADRQGEIRVAGRTIESQGALLAPGGKITLAASDPNDPTGARIYLDAGSQTSVAGDWADVPFADNLLTFKVTSNELANSPDQKGGLLEGATVTVDLRTGSPLLDLSGYIAAQSRTVAEKAATGGELALTSTGSLIERPGATLDASGGGYRYAAGTSTTSLLLGDDGRIYNISSAPEQRGYTAVLDTFTENFSRWGQTLTFSGLTYGVGQVVAGYVEGQPGGSITLQSAAGLVLDGSLLGGVTVGPNQLAQAPRGATLTIGTFDPTTSQFGDAQRIGNVTFAQQAADTLGSDFNVATVLGAAQTDNVTIGADQLSAPATTGMRDVYVQNAFDSVEINSNGRVVVPEGVTIEGSPGSSLTLRAPQIDVAGSIAMPAGGITLQPVATLNPISGDLGPASNAVTVRGTAHLSTAGVWINNASSDGSFVGDPLPSARLNVAADGSTSTTSMLTGGAIVIATNSDETSATVLERGAVLDVGGGAAINSANKLSVGNGGTLSIANGQSDALSSDWLQADLWGLSPGNGGRLTLSTPRVVIDAADANGTLPANTTRLLPDLFSAHGFSSVTVNATQGIAVSDGATITLQQTNRVIDTVQAAQLPTGGDVRQISDVELLPDDQRQAVNLTLAAKGFGPNQGQSTLTMAKGATIVADPKAAVSLSAVDGLEVDGRISAPGGAVSLTLAAPQLGAPDLVFGPTGSISVAGTFVRQPTNNGLVQGTVVDAGSITIAATGAGVNLAPGSQLDLSGITQVVESIPADGSGVVLRQSVDGNAGALVIRSQGATELQSTMYAASGSPQGAGGAFALELNAADAELSLPAERRIVVAQQSPATLPAADPGFVDAEVSIDALRAAGFDKLRLQSENRIELQGDVAMNFERGIRLDAPLIEITGDGRVSLAAASVALGQSLDPRTLTGSAPYVLAPQAPSPVLPTQVGAGLLSVQAETIDLFGSLTLDGVSETRLFAGGDIRMTGRNVLTSDAQGDRAFGAQVGSLTTAGNIVLSATQIYPSTRSDFTITVTDQPGGPPSAGGSISVTGNGNPAGDVYSAGGRLTLAADTIVQGGTIKAPLGEIDLQAVSRLELSPGSVTSVSAAGLTIPFGSTLAGLAWSYQDNLAGGTPNLLVTTSADAKRISLAGQSIDVRAGATVDLSGGGDVQAAEFVPGSGGSSDILVQPNTYAIIPKSDLTSLPVDTALAAAHDIGFGLQSAKYDSIIYDSLTIGTGAAVPAGQYILLPGRYALLPGAYLVQLQTGAAYTNLQLGQTTQLANGQTVVAGRRSVFDTPIQQSQTVGVIVRPGSVATTESDYTLTTSSYFTALAAQDRSATPRVPLDAGQLTISDVTALDLTGQFLTAPGTSTVAGTTQTGLMAEVDISADKIAVVDHSGSPVVDASYLQLESGALSALGGSLLLGGERSGDSSGVRITSQASEIIVANSSAAPLQVPELMLAATDTIDVRAGSVLAGRGASTAGMNTTLSADAGGALVRLSSGAQASVDRGAVIDTTHGTIRIESGAVLSADGALLLDATQTTQSQGTFDVAAGGAVSLASSKVSLGETSTVTGISDGLVLSNSDLAGLTQLGSLLIKGYQGIDLFGSVNLGATTLGQLTLDSAELRGHSIGSAPTAEIAAHDVRLVNSGNAGSPSAQPQSGTLTIDANNIVIDSGDQRVSGFSSVTMNAASEVVAQGAGSMTVASDWTVKTPKIAVAAGANQLWQAADLSDPANPVYAALQLESAAGTAGTTADGAAGGRLSLEGRSVSVGTLIQAQSGVITLSAKGSDPGDGVTLAAGAVLDASASAKDYNGNVVVADAGTVSLSAAAGAVSIAPGAVVKLGSSPQGGNAGLLEVTAARLDLGGSLDATAAAGAIGGQAQLDLGTLADFSTLNAALARGGFNEAIDLRLRSGDLEIAAGDVVTARNLVLSSDNGRIDVAGVLDSRSDRGGASVDLSAANGLSLAAGSQVLAAGTSTDPSAADAYSNGGTVRLATAAGSLDFDASAIIDVSPGAKGNTGSVTFVVDRDASNQVGASHLAGTVLGRSGGVGTLAEVALEAQRTYTSTGTISASDIAGYAADNAAFITGTDPTALLGALKADGGVSAAASLRGATEVRASGDLTLAQNWDLTTSQWLANGQPGTLTLRAGGDLTVSSALGMPNDNLIAGETWNLRLVGGADLTAADAMATLSLDAAQGHGSVLLSGDNAKLRTGTGSIDIAAAYDFRMDSPQSVVYTAGRIGAIDTAVNGNNRWSSEGGDISIRAGHDAVGSANEWITEWLRRPRSASASTPAEWWTYRPNFQQGIGALGGGNVGIDAGNDVNNLSAMLPTSGRSVVDASGNRSVDVEGGGDLSVMAGNNVIGGSYLVARGVGQIEARGSVGATAPTQLYLMGVSSGDVPATATMSVSAGADITLQSVNNPTTLAQVASTGTGPSFGAGPTQVLTFFTYAPDSTVRLLSESGNVTVGSQMAPGRGLGAANPTLTDVTTAGAFPATLTAAAFDGDVSLGLTRSIMTFPSTTAQVDLLANGSLLDPNLAVSDLSPNDVPGLQTPLLGNRPLSGETLLAAGSTDRIVERSVVDGYLFDLQGLTGDVGGSGANASTLSLPAASRVEAGTDITNVALTLQNLNAADVSEVRADSGDIRPAGIEIRGPGTLIVQAGRNVDLGQSAIYSGPNNLGGLIATGNNANPALPSSDAAHLVVIAGVSANVDPSTFKAAYDELIALNGSSDEILAFYRTLNGDPNPGAVLAAGSVSDLVAHDKAYAPYAALVTSYPFLLTVYQQAAKSGSLPLGVSADATEASQLYALLNRETDVTKIVDAKSVADLVNGTLGGSAYQAFVAFDAKYPLVFSDYRARRSSGATPQGLTPILFSDALAEVTAEVVPASATGSGSIFTFQSSIQTYGNGQPPASGCTGQCSGQGDIDLWAPGGSVIAGLTTPSPGTTIGVVTNGGGAIRSVVGGDFQINQGKVLTAQGGDILLYSSGGSIDAGRGAKTSISTPPPTRTPITVGGVVVGYLYTVPASASGSGIQTLTSDPDGIGPRVAPPAGNVYLFAPAGTIDAGEAGIRSSGNLVLNAQTVLNASNISASGSSVGVPVVASGSLASSLASSGANVGSASKSAEDTAAAAASAASAAAAATLSKPNILTVEVLGFGDKNCKEQDKDCFAK